MTLAGSRNAFGAAGGRTQDQEIAIESPARATRRKNWQQSNVPRASYATPYVRAPSRDTLLNALASRRAMLKESTARPVSGSLRRVKRRKRAGACSDLNFLQSCALLGPLWSWWRTGARDTVLNCEMCLLIRSSKPEELPLELASAPAITARVP